MPQHNTSSFGRGWIPGDRDIGLPGETPLLHAEGVGGRPEPGAAYDAAHSSPSRMGEGLCMALPFTPDRRIRFLHLLATIGNVRRACAGVGVSPQSAYVHKRRDSAFAAGWDAALLLARDAAEEVLAERALHGTHETIFYRGEAVGSRVRFDARLLLAHLARLDRHADQAEGAGVIAARFDDYLAELHAGEPLFQPPDHDLDGPAEWYPARPTREEALLAARRKVLSRFPDKAEDLPAETLAAIDSTGLDQYDLWAHALAHAQREAEAVAADAWDAEAGASLTALDALLAEDAGEGACAMESGGGEGRAVMPEAGRAPPCGEAPLEVPFETKAFAAGGFRFPSGKFPSGRFPSELCQPCQPAVPRRPVQSTKSSAVSAVAETT